MKYYVCKGDAKRRLERLGVPSNKCKDYITYNQEKMGWCIDLFQFTHLIGKPHGPTSGELIKALILSGKTNDEVWEVIQPLFNLPPEKIQIVRWWRCDLRRRGALPENTRVYNRKVWVKYHEIKKKIR